MANISSCVTGLDETGGSKVCREEFCSQFIYLLLLFQVYIEPFAYVMSDISRKKNVFCDIVGLSASV